MMLEKYSIGVGDRFAHQGQAQLQALRLAATQGRPVTPVWNKSFREHAIIGSSPRDTRDRAAQAVQAMGWQGTWHVDADHIGLSNVDLFVEHCDFFTLDVADYIGESADPGDIQTFVDKHRRYVGALSIPDIDDEFEVTADTIEAIASAYLHAVRQAGAIYRRIEAVRGADQFITEVSMDETPVPQTPLEMLFILAAIADEGIPAQTIAPRFAGRFNKGVDYVGDVERFALEFQQHLAVIAFAIDEFGLPENLKLSVHSGSDKFSIYEPIRQAIDHADAGLHLKTAGTTWLEECVGLAESGGAGLAIVREIYRAAHQRFDELCGPYATVIDIDRAALPDPALVEHWNGERLARALRHEPECHHYDPNLRQLLHVGYKVAAEMGKRFTDALTKNASAIAPNVTRNLLERHILRVFPGPTGDRPADAL